MDKSLVGKCGLYCGACSIYRAQRDDVELRSQIAERAKCDQDKVKCYGCGDLSSECWGKGCKIVICQQAKGFSYCFECEEYLSNSCSKFEKLAQTYMEVGIDLRINLENIKNGLTEAWLKESEDKFKCPTCMKPHSAWASRCQQCGLILRL